MSVGTLIDLLARIPLDREVIICDPQGNDHDILAVTDGGEEGIGIIDLGTQDDIAATEEWPIGWNRV